MINDTDFLSIVVPAYKEERTIAKKIEALDKILSELVKNFEIIVVVDGNADKTYEEAKKIRNKSVKVYGYEKNEGKGYAVKLGVLKARGDIIGFIDADMDIDPSSISILLNYLNFYKADIVIGSKLHPDSVISYPYWRKFISWGYRTVTSILFNFKIRDTQSGLKLFNKKVAKDVFPKIRVKNFAFDIEVLALASALGYNKIYEAPVKLSLTSGSISSFNFWKIAAIMFKDTITVFYRLRLTRQYHKT